MVLELSRVMDAIKLLHRAEEITRETDPIKVATFCGECRMARWRLETAIAGAQVQIIEEVQS